MNADWLAKAGTVLGVYFLGRIWVGWRGSRRQRTALTTPLVDGALLEAAFTARPKEGDDPDLLAELRDTFAHLNRQAYAEEFWGLHAQIVALDSNLGAPQRATLRRALLRLLLANDRWLQLVAAKACAALGVREAVRPLRALLELGDTHRFTAEKAEYSAAETADLRCRRELEAALATLEAV